MMNDSIKAKVKKYIDEKHMLDNVKHVVCGVSGGADSVLLLMLLNDFKDHYGYDITVVHVNHNIRGDEALRDQNFVAKLCENLGVEFVLKDVDIIKIAKETGESTEEAGRRIRYEAFAEGLKEDGVIAVAHNMDDDVETVLLNIFRGTGIKGLTGIPAKRQNIIRPLLALSSDEIRNYLLANDIDFVVDSTNLKTDYTRNKIRQMVLPYLKNEINEGVNKNILNMSELATELDDFVAQSVEEAFAKYGTVTEEKVFISCEISSQHSVIRKGVFRMAIKAACGKLKDITKVHILSVDALLDMQVGKVSCLPYELIARRTYDGIEVKKVGSEINSAVRCEMNVEVLEHICQDAYFDEINENKYTKYLDYDKITSGLVLRHRQTGDYIVVDENGHKKKLKDYFIDAKIPKEERDNIWLLCDQSRVVWIVGYRGGFDVNVTEETTKVAKVTVVFM